MTNEIKLRDFTIGNDENLSLMGGMNVLESRDLAMNARPGLIGSLLVGLSAAKALSWSTGLLVAIAPNFRGFDFCPRRTDGQTDRRTDGQEFQAK